MKVVRNTEKKILEKHYKTSQNSVILLYGTNYSKKEDLLQEFIADKDALYFRSRDVSVEEQKRLFFRSMESYFGSVLVDASYEDAFRKMRSKSKEKVIIVLDEFQNFLKRDPSILDTIEKLKKGDLYERPVMVILAMSSLAWTVREFDEVAGKAASCIDERVKLEELSFLDVVRTFPHYSVSDAVKTYGILGGVPAYLETWEEKKTVRQNVIETILNPNGSLYRAAEHYLGDELRELSVYTTILASIARGNEKLNDLYQDTGYSRAKISVYLKNLAEFDAIDKVVSFETGGWDNAKKGIYRIKNHFLRFYFTFLYPNLSEFYTMTPAAFYDKFVEPNLAVFLRPTFSEVCTEYLSLMNMVGKTPIKLDHMGTWLGKAGTIDIVGQNDIRENIVGVCNWDEPRFPQERYELLLENMTQARIKAKAIYLFSATEFDLELKKLEKQNPSVILVDMKEL